jgi:hypothetical protein
MESPLRAERHGLCLLAAAMLLCGVAQAAADGRDFACTLPPGSHGATSLKMLPAAIRGALGATADRGAFFQRTDIVRRPGPFKRFIRGGRSGATWFVWYEQGGRTYGKHVALFRTDAAGVWHIADDRRIDATADLCAETGRLLDGVKPAR